MKPPNPTPRVLDISRADREALDRDCRLYGTAFMRIAEDGFTATRVDPATVYIRPPGKDDK